MTASTVINNIVIHPAAFDDFEWVADLMAWALRPFYDGDHRAQAQRIFNTHIRGGYRPCGHFSAGQYMFILEQDGQSIGLIYVAGNKQHLISKLDKQALQRFTPASEVAIEMLAQKVNGPPPPKFVEKALYGYIEREEEEIRSQTEGFAVPVR